MKSFNNWLRENNLYTGEYLANSIKEILFDNLEENFNSFEIQEFYDGLVSNLEFESIFNYETIQDLVNNIVNFKNYIIAENLTYDILKCEFNIDLTYDLDFRILACEPPLNIFNSYDEVLDDLDYRFGDCANEDLEKEIILFETENKTKITTQKIKEIRLEILESYDYCNEYQVFRNVYYSSYNFENMNYYSLDFKSLKNET